VLSSREDRQLVYGKILLVERREHRWLRGGSGGRDCIGLEVLEFVATVVTLQSDGYHETGRGFREGHGRREPSKA
jgi:hypothetical protein